MTKLLINDIIKEEAKRFNNIVYSSKPYACALPECLSFFEDRVVDEERYTIEREEGETRIMVKPVKGSGARKIYVIRLWTSWV